MSILKKASLAAGFILFLAQALPLKAAVYSYDSGHADALVTYSTLVVQGRVVSEYMYEHRSVILTEHQIEIESIILGEFEGELLTVSYPGGEVNDRFMYADNYVDLDVGSSYILFITPAEQSYFPGMLMITYSQYGAVKISSVTTTHKDDTERSKLTSYAPEQGQRKIITSLHDQAGSNRTVRPNELEAILAEVKQYKDSLGASIPVDRLQKLSESQKAHASEQHVIQH